MPATSSVDYYFASRNLDAPAKGGKAAYKKPVEKLKLLLKVVPAGETRLREVLQIALKSDKQIIADEALAYLIARFSNANPNAPTGGSRTPSGKYTPPVAKIKALIAALPPGQDDLKKALEVAARSDAEIVSGKALEALAAMFGASAAVAAAGAKGKGQAGKGTSAKKAKADPVGDFQQNVLLCQSIDERKAKDAKPSVLSQRPVRSSMAAGGVDEATALAAENTALKRSLRAQDPRVNMSVRDQNKLFLGIVPVVSQAGASVAAACPCAAAAAAFTAGAGLPAGFQGWVPEQAAAFAASLGIPPAMAAVLRDQDVDGPALTELTFEQLKQDGFSTGMAHRLLRAIAGRTVPGSSAVAAPAPVLAPTPTATAATTTAPATTTAAAAVPAQPRAARTKESKKVSSGHYTGCKNDCEESKNKWDCDCRARMSAHTLALRKKMITKH